MKLLNDNTPEDTFVKNLKTGEVWLLKFDYPHKKVLFLNGHLKTVLKYEYKNWALVAEFIDFEAPHGTLTEYKYL